MKRIVLIVATVGLALFAILLFRASTHDARGASTNPVVLNPPRNTEVFTPASGGESPNLTAQQAIEVFQAKSPEFDPPKDAAYELGYYTAAVGNGEDYRYQDRLVWAIRWDWCPIYMPPPNVKAIPTRDPNDPCRFWLFLDANTGEMLEGTWQQAESASDSAPALAN
ncbi:MAG TPA: hypothetical protein VKA30_07770 [Actinomycetota bacterium]|nr:hypothetical protein [Actinomycetota bacterium]